ncbi:NAD-dependent malic enzyme [Granulibacter bethesdensis]|uniref:Malolactic enzyme n=1 Tax=Granulibacter bethesdensis TaxID=364410 RepID=A0AAN0RFC6_9PROT|nr:NAD-dependent malic enzyme [Granulibacter bethesdensis]AHJ63905.1 NAD-dependent malic enzyme [Granulibacter bethesdensis]
MGTTPGTELPNAAGEHVVEVSRTGYELLSDPLLNKGMAFSEDERTAFHLHGLLPPHVGNLDEQVNRRLTAFRELKSPINRYIFLRDLQDTNETLFYALLSRNLEEMMPVVYTPTVGLGCQNFSRLFRKPRGLFLSPPHQEQIDEILSHPRFDHVQVIVVSDGERILGLGDQGAGGMGIPIGKLALYTACGGIPPWATLPILLDTGTDNKERHDDPLYIGWRHERIRGEAYDSFIDTFVGAVQRRWPHVLLQWEDFARPNAGRLLTKYRDQLCTFNDDIQGTASVTVGTLMAAASVAGVPMKDQRIVVVGAGSAGVGIARMLRQAMIEEGVPEHEAHRRFFLVDRDGLLREGDNDLAAFQQEFAVPADVLSHWDDREKPGLEAVIRNAHPTTLIGVSGQPGLFTEAAIREMAQHVARPVIFPLSNPTANAEATPADLLAWTDGQAIIGTGSPFDPVQINGRTIMVDQTNNSYIFPGVGLGAIASRAEHVTDAMFLAAARALAEMSPARTDPALPLLPHLAKMRDVSRHVAVAVGLCAMQDGQAEPCDEETLRARVDDLMWEPQYPTYRRVEPKR